MPQRPAAKIRKTWEIFVNLHIGTQGKAFTLSAKSSLERLPKQISKERVYTK